MTLVTDDGGIRAETVDGVLRLTIDRPERKGAIDPVAVGQLVAHLEGAATSNSLCV